MGAAALSLLMTPVVIRSVEEMLRLVPNELREASYALGVPKWLTIVKVVLRTAIAGIVTGVMLAVARVIGETAPAAAHCRHHHPGELGPVRRSHDHAPRLRVQPVLAGRLSGSTAPGPQRSP